MELKKVLYNPYVRPVILYFLFGIMTYLYSLIKNISWINVLYLIPLFIWIGLLILFIIWICIVYIRKRMNYGISPYSVGPPRNGWNNVGNEDYSGVKWNIRIPNYDPLFDPGLFGVKKTPRFDVDEAPRCPECENKLEIIDNFLYYTWYCPRCKFKKYSWDSVDITRDRLQSFIDSDVEREMKKMNLKERGY
jgi:hypothetical protein